MNATRDRPKCPQCGNEIDPDYCWCGACLASHNEWWTGHGFVPMGCTCGFDDGTVGPELDPNSVGD